MSWTTTTGPQELAYLAAKKKTRKRPTVLREDRRLPFQMLRPGHHFRIRRDLSSVCQIHGFCREFPFRNVAGFGHRVDFLCVSYVWNFYPAVECSNISSV